jgi:hypothetical protein
MNQTEQTYKAIETVYDGYRFRSRLEARWAVFFNAMGIKYKYEDEGYKYSSFERKKLDKDGKEIIDKNGYPEYEDDMFYLPDFYLPDFDVYCEVKGSDNALHRDFDKLTYAIDYFQTPMSEAGLMILGEIPHFVRESYIVRSLPAFPLLIWHKGVRFTFSTFTIVNGGHIKILKGTESFAHGNYIDLPGDEYLIAGDSCEDVLRILSTSCRCIGEFDQLYPLSQEGLKVLYAAYDNARQARFEHGEKG